jgi:hypothetical protein
MTLGDLHVTSDPLYYNSAPDVDDAEARLGIRLPAGYREFIARFGEGFLGGCIRVYPPYQILEGDNNVSAWRERISEYWFWDAGADVLTKDRALECVIVADTIDGDELVAHPSAPDRLYVLPRYDEMIYVAGDGLLPAIEWMLTSGILTEPTEDQSFAPFDGRLAADA